MSKKPLVIAIEEHYADAEVAATFQGRDATKAPKIAERLEDLVDIRIREMDAAGIDMQVLSHTAPSVQKLDPESAVRLARLANDRFVRDDSGATGSFFRGSRPCRRPIPRARGRRIRARRDQTRPQGGDGARSDQRPILG